MLICPLPTLRWILCASLVPLTTLSVAATPAELQHGRLLQQMLHEAGQGPLLQSALVAGGAGSPAEFARYRYRVDRCVANAEQRILDLDVRAQWDLLQIILDSLHDTILTGNYCAGCDNVCRTLDTGDYNCVTASVIFKIVANILEVPAEVEFLPQHVRCRATLDAGTFVVETTDRRGMRQVDADDAGRLLNDRELVAKLYYNRALELLRKQKFSTALQYAELAWRMDPAHTAAHENVAIVACRWAAALAAQQRWPLALSLLHQARISTGLGPLLGNTEVSVLDSWTQWAVLEGNARQRRRVEEELRLAIGQQPGNHALLQLLHRLTAN